MEKQQLEEIQELLKTVNMKAVEIQLEQMKLDDNTTVIEAEVFEADQPVMIVTEDEQMIPLPVGEYGLEDGRILVVQEEGVIFEVKDAQSEEEVTEPAMEEEVAASEKTVAPVAKKVIEAVTKESYFSAQDFEDLKSKVEELQTKLSEVAKKDESEDIELSHIKPISHNPENKVEMSIDVSKGSSIVDFLNNRK